MIKKNKKESKFSNFMKRHKSGNFDYYSTEHFQDAFSPEELKKRGIRLPASLATIKKHTDPDFYKDAKQVYDEDKKYGRLPSQRKKK